VITPRATRVLRVAGLRHFRQTLVSLASEGQPLDARDRLFVVPTHAAGAHLRRAIEHLRLRGTEACIFPEMVTRDELTQRLASRALGGPPLLSAIERGVLMAAACRRAADTGTPPPFRLRPGLVAEILGFYDALRRQRRSVDAFERLTLDSLEPNAPIDRGADRLVHQTRFLVASFRAFEAASAATGAVDEHVLRTATIDVGSVRPWTHVIVAVGDRASSPYGLWPCDYDLLSRVAGLSRLDIVATEAALSDGLRERLHDVLPDVDDVSVPDEGVDPGPCLVTQAPPAGAGPAAGPVLVHIVRDREEEVAGFARSVRERARQGEGPPLERVALVVRRPLPYVYLAREVLRSAGVPCQMFDALPLAAEPYAAALDLVLSSVTSNHSQAALMGLLGSPHLVAAAGRAPTPAAVHMLGRRLKEAGYLGGEAELAALIEHWANDSSAAAVTGAGAAALVLVRELAPLGSRQPASGHLGVLRSFLAAHDRLPGLDDALAPRHLRARAAILAGLAALDEAYAAHDPASVDFADLAFTIRGWIETQTFAPRTGTEGVHVVDAESAAFGEFDDVQLAGLVEGEWPQRPRRGIFYSPGLLKPLGWPAESERLAGERSLFRNLLRLPMGRLLVSAFSLEDDAIVSASPFADDVVAAGLAQTVALAAPARVFEEEALTMAPMRPDVLPVFAAAWARLRWPGLVAGYTPAPASVPVARAAAWSVSALERYQDCPFKFFAADVLRLEEPPEDRSVLTPRTRGRFIHEVFQHCFEAWDERGGTSITPERIGEARALFVAVAEEHLAGLPESDVSLERSRLLGSPAALGVIDVVLGLEASRDEPVERRWLEYRLDGEFSLGASDGRRASLRGVVDRVDLLSGRRLRVIDYKSGTAPNAKRALQVPIYALCASERLQQQDGQGWTVHEAAYVALSGKRSLAHVVRAGSGDAGGVLDAARERVFSAIDAIDQGEFPPRPHDTIICGYCAFGSVCRKDYVGDE